MTEYEEEFLKAYYLACNTSKSMDWMDAAMAAKRLYNQSRKPGNEAKEREIQINAESA